ncbi:MAG: cohesin domain-containing protein [candidate division KSB1 bacterium]|nr:cohesin domain-containing protein [candidate division KSB1 bacterium]MDZ7319265.1 cohesin domain-containing protein [candidate division KSB1 bacterium]MDZ7341499.1 cohesin domain-containing protein [candidate division KSB1 bacterium]
MRISIISWCLIFVIIITSGWAQVKVSLPDTTAMVNTQVSIPVSVADVASYQIYSYQFTLNYNSALFTPIRVESEKTISASWPTPVMNNSTAGSLIVGGYGANKLTGSGRLVNIVFEVIGQVDQVSNLTFASFIFNTGSPQANTGSGRIKIINNLVPVTITTNVLNGTQVVVDGVAHTAPYTTSWEKGASHQISVASPQVINNNQRYSFQSWSDQGSQTHTVSVTAAVTLTANFNAEYYLTVQSPHGNPQGNGWYKAGQTARFSVDATALEDSTTKRIFTSWTGAGAGSYSGTAREASVVMNGPITETANWTTQYYVDIVSAQGHPFGNGWYNAGAVANFGVDSTIIVQPKAHYQFRSWTGTGSGSYTGTSPKASITVNGPILERANWDAEYLVETGSSPEGVLSVPGAGWYKQGQQFTSIKAPTSVSLNQTVYSFKGWKVNDQLATGNPVIVTIDEPKRIVADYNSEVTVVVTTTVGPGTKVIVDGEEKPAPFTTSWILNSKHSIGVVNVQLGEPGTRYVYQRWSHGGNQTQEVVATSNVTYSAELVTQYYLEVKDEPKGIVNPHGSGWYPAQQVVRLDSLPQVKLLGNNSSIRLKKWIVDGADSLKSAIAIAMDKPRTAIAVYQTGWFIAGSITFIGGSTVPIIFQVTGTENFEVTGNSDGTYAIGGLVAGDYTVTPIHRDYRFEPASRSYSISANEEYQYYVAFYNPSAVENDDQSPGISNGYRLYQNHPNPFSDATAIEFYVPQAMKVTVTIYNVLGQVVQQLVNWQLPAGRHRVQWLRTDAQGRSVPQGVYFYRLEAGSVIQMRKMIVI